MFFVAAFAFALELTLSLVRVIKNRSFVKQCWSIRFILWCWRTFIKVCECIRHSFGKLRRMLFRDYKTRNVVLLFTAYSVVLAFLAAVFGGVFGAQYVKASMVLVRGMDFYVPFCVSMLIVLAGHGVSYVRRQRKRA